ncbi:GDSL esterase/lipase 1 [Vitis vinifera]|uniref:GDSL esterase/lipase 1 n=2 Tax=Vitis vinifera TaxID=29760 RepID=A0A438K7L0_VITVI|nr:GDSL esterase/lipase 1 [Vitis vinifera]CAN69490.1 hypothetical protein VITISV_015487 [Vitis vinifera]
MASLSFHFCVLMVMFAGLISPPICHARFQEPKKHVPLFILGDSLFDPGNNIYLNTTPESSAFWPYGETFFKRATGRFSDGRLVPDFIAEYMNLPMIPPYLQPGPQRFIDGSNFASAGAGVLPETNFEVISLPQQLRYFKGMVKVLKHQLDDAEAKKLLKRAVYLFSIGGNDYLHFYDENTNASQSEKREYVGIVIGNLTIALKEIYGLGGRKIAFQDAGLLGCLPSSRSGTKNGACAEKPSALARLHNMALAKALKELESSLPGFKYAIFDYYKAISQRTDNPSEYGFKEAKTACCGSGPYRASNCGGERGRKKFELCRIPGDYLWFDGGHGTERANRQLAELLWGGGPSSTAPRNLKQLVELEIM